MEALERFKETVLKEYPRLSSKDTFKFGCSNKLSCFNKCCRDVNIFLTPYDTLRMKQALNISSTEFLEKYTLLPLDKNLKYPVVLLAMRDDEEKRCNFVTEEGCSIYGNRPWACRMYPIGLASPNEGASEEEFYFLMHEDVCDGLGESKEWTPEEWMEDQGIISYHEFGETFKEIILHKRFQEGEALTAPQMEMFYMACYDLDKFRSFIFESTFLDRFEFDEERLESLKADDEELLLFGFEWLKFCLFKEQTMKIKERPANTDAP